MERKYFTFIKSPAMEPFVCMCVYIHKCIYIYIYMYGYYIYIYIYMYIYIYNTHIFKKSIAVIKLTTY